MKTQNLKTLDSYSTIASRAKLCLEAEQRRRIGGGWVDRVLVLDKATLYSYRTKGETGSLNGWAVGGTEIYVKRPRRDGRHIVIMSRPHVYNVAFSLNSVHEQGTFIHALSTSGTTVMGLNGIILLSDFKRLKEGVRRSLVEQQMPLKGEVNLNWMNKDALEGMNQGNTTKKPLMMPQLSSRMLEVTWTFNNSTDIPNDGDTVDNGNLLNPNLYKGNNDINHGTSDSGTIGNEGQVNMNIYSTITFGKGFESEKNSADVMHDDCEHSFHFEKEMKDNKTNMMVNKFALDISMSGSEIKDKESNVSFEDVSNCLNMRNDYNETKTNLDAPEETSFRKSYVSLKTRKILKREDKFESNEPNEKTEAKEETKNKNENHENNLKNANLESDHQNLAQLRYDIVKINNEINATKQNESNTYNLITEQYKTERKYMKLNKIELSCDNEEKRFRLKNNDKSYEIILSGFIGVAQRIGGKYTKKTVELKQGGLVIYPVMNSTKQSDEGVCNQHETLRHSDSIFRTNLEGVSVSPLLGKDSNSLVMKKKNKCIAVLQLGTREELMNWIHAISDEVMNVTCSTKRSSLTIYPTILPENKQSIEHQNTREIEKPDNAPPKDTFSNDTEEVNNAEPVVFKTLKRRLAIRRASRNIEKIIVLKQVDGSYDSKSSENGDDRDKAKTIIEENSEQKSRTDNVVNFLNASEINSDPNYVQSCLIQGTHINGNSENNHAKSSHTKQEQNLITKDKEVGIKESNKAKVYSLKNSSEQCVNKDKDSVEDSNSFPAHCINGDNCFSEFSCTCEISKSNNISLINCENNNKIIPGKTDSMPLNKPSNDENKTNYIIVDNSSLSNIKKYKLEQNSVTEIDSCKPIVHNSLVTDRFLDKISHKSYNKAKTVQHSKGISETNVKNIIKNYNDISKCSNSQELKLFKPHSNNSKALNNPKIMVTPSVIQRSKEETPQYIPDDYLLNTKIQKENLSHVVFLNICDDNLSRKKSLKRMTDNDKHRSISKMKVTWSVSDLKERFEILNTGSKETVNPKTSWSNKSINRRKMAKNSIRRKKIIEGEYRIQASIRRNLRRGLL